MNRIFKVVWNESRGIFTVCDEYKKSHGKTKSAKTALAVTAITAMMGFCGVTQADPVVKNGTIYSFAGVEDNTAIIYESSFEGASLRKNDNGSITIAVDAEGKSVGLNGVLTNMYTDNSNNLDVATSGLSVTDSNFANVTTDNAGAVVLWNNKDSDTGTTPSTISNSSFTNNKSTYGGGALSVLKFYDGENPVDLNVTNSTFEENSSKLGGAIFNETNGTKISISGSRFENNSAQHDQNDTESGRGGAIYSCNDGDKTITINNSSFTGNTAGYVSDVKQTKDIKWSQGGAIAYSGGILNIDNVQFESNTAGMGGAVSQLHTKDHTATDTLNITNSTFSGNMANAAGAISAMRTVMIDNSTFTGNTAIGDTDGGGAMFVGAESDTIITHTTFDGNKSLTSSGGAIDTRKGDLGNNKAAKLEITDSVFKNNEALGENVTSLTSEQQKEYTGKGGAIRNAFYGSKTDPVRVTLAGTQFENNKAIYGGAIYNEYSGDVAETTDKIARMAISDSTFTGNTAKTQGGAIYNSENAEITFRGTNTFSGNTANGEDNDIDNAGTITIASGTTTLNGGITSRGTINVDDGATLNAENTTLSEGTLHVAGTMNVNTLKGEASSTITVGNEQSAGKLSVGNLQLNGGTLFLDPVWVDGTGIEGASQAGIESWENGIDGTLAIGRNSLAVLGEKTTDWTQAAFASTERNWGEDDITAALAIRAPQTLTSTGEIRVDGTMTTAPASSSNSVTFDKNTMLIVDAAKIGDSAAITGDGSSTATIADSAALHIANAKNGQNVEILKDFGNIDITNGWQGDNLTSSDAMISLNVAEAKDDNSGRFTVGAAANRAEDVLPGVVTVNTMNTIWNDGQNDTAAQGGIGFLSRAADNRYLSHQDAVRTINGAAQMAVAAGVQLSNLQALNSVTEALENHISLTTNTQQVHAPRFHDEGADLWASMLYRHGHGDGMKSGSFHSDVNNNFGGIIVGGDYTWKLAGDTQIRAGAALSIGKGDSHSDGDYNYSKNDYDTYDINLYGSWNNQNVNIIADAGYMKGDNEVEQHLSQNLGGKLKADVDTEMWTAGIKGEYRIQTDAVDITPHLGVRYTHLKTDSFSSGNALGTVFNTDSESYNIWQMPVGVTLSKDYKAENGWVVKPKFDFSVIGAAGDTEAETRVRVPGVNAADSAKADMMDSVSFKGVIGVEMQKEATSIGLSAGYQQSATMNSTGFMIQVGHHF